MGELVRQGGPPATLEERARDYIKEAKSANTRRAYRSDWEHFTGWCEGHGQLALPATPATLALYISDLAASHKPSTITRRLSSISQAHQLLGMSRPQNLPWCGSPCRASAAQKARRPR